MKVLIVGSGAREHALAWRISQSRDLSSLWVAGGNAGTSQLATNLPVNPEDVEGVVTGARSLGIDLVVVGPEVPLSMGLVDKLNGFGIPAFGPSGAAAQIESSKSFALNIMRNAGVPCPDFHVFQDQGDALDFLTKHSGPLVVKADGLAAGKGVSLCQTAEESSAAVHACMDNGIFGEAGKTVVLEEMLTGPEVSVFAFCDGGEISELTTACDYKRLEDGGLGPNTGGMGSFAPADLWSPALREEVNRTIMLPVVHTMADMGIPYQGVLYAGIMLTPEGPKVLEFNCRLGDPESQVLLPNLESDPLEVMMACCQGSLSRTSVKWSNKHHVGVVMVSGGYPLSYRTGFEISGLDQECPDTLVFHAGTVSETGARSSRVVTDGGRVLTVVGMGNSLAQARAKAYDRLQQISFHEAFYRMDIGDLEAEERAWSPGPAAAGQS
mgnify:FL=1